MGNFNTKETIDKHQKLHKQIKNGKIDNNLLIFNIPTKKNEGQISYSEKILSASEEELNDTTYNELYISSFGIKITNFEVKFIKNGSIKKDIEVLGQNFEDEYIHISKHFEFDDEKEPDEILKHIEKIIYYQEEIYKIEKKIAREKLKIIQNDYVQSKLKKNISGKKEYLKTLKFLNEYFEKKSSKK